MAPKVYGFDTGFVCYAQGKTELRAEDTGFMWEHCVLNEMLGRLQTRTMHYWRNKSGHEIDFVIPHRKTKSITAIECKFLINQDAIALKSLVKNFASFRRYYPDGENLVVASNIQSAFTRKIDDISISFVSPEQLVDVLV